MADPVETPAEGPVEALILDLLEYLANRPSSYDEVMSAWRTSCPRLPVWEDANDRGLVKIEHLNQGLIVRVTREGLSVLENRRPSRSPKA
jgi:D-3-phosphoglycerate dehydrogenase